MVDSHISGMPDCTLMLNDRFAGAENRQLRKESQIEGRQQSVVLDDATFHHCVRLSNFQQSRQITFIPPDGKFTLMKFSVSNEIKQPFMLNTIFTPFGRNRAQVVLNLRANFSQKNSAEKVSVFIPAPPNMSGAKIDTKHGKARLTKQGDQVEWRVGSMVGHETAELKLELNTTTTTDMGDLRDWKKPPITMKFEIDMYTASGIEIQNLHVVEKSTQNINKWLKCVTTAGDYMIKW